MGTWGTGLKENDEAQDALIQFGSQLETCIQSRSGVTILLQQASGPNKKLPNAVAVLALTEMLLEAGVLLPAPSMPLIVACLGMELVDASGYDSPADRVKALAKFGVKLYASLAEARGQTIVVRNHLTFDGDEVTRGQWMRKPAKPRTRKPYQKKSGSKQS